MAENPNNEYPTIYFTGTDADLPEWFTNDFHKYRSLQPMAGGGNGDLFAADDGNLGRKVCIKRLSDKLSKDKTERRRLLREARVTAQMSHPNTVPVYELGKDHQGNLYFAMKKIEGRDLFKILTQIARKDPDALREFSLDRLLGILIQASNALAYAHAHGVIHRDIKPENIMAGLFGEVMLMDWGVAKVWGMADEPTDGAPQPQIDLEERLTSPGQRPGTPLYMSPEQVRGSKSIDERSDIFSMGVVLYEVLALREPFRGRTIDVTFKNILNLTPKPPSEVAVGRKISKRLDEICFKAIEKKPVDRYQSIQHMINDIRDFRNQAIQASVSPDSST
ncbi:MAG: protein kinase [Planctomycetaceae bacterium]|nr:protein kinase [Planctomycetaceae bacterium]